jgi:hypothetical protein
MTYFIHGALNNFLDADKVAVPFWLFLAYLVYKKESLQYVQSSH